MKVEEYQKENWIIVKSYSRKIAKRLTPAKDKAIIYAGKSHGFNLSSELVKVLPAGKEQKNLSTGKIFDLKPIYKLIEQANKTAISETGNTKFDMVTDVLKRIPAPRLYQPKTGAWKKAKNMKVLSVNLAGKEGFLSDKDNADMWAGFSRSYAKNAKGKIAVFRGFEDGFADLDKRFKDFLKTEIPIAFKKSGLDSEVEKKILHILRTYWGWTIDKNKRRMNLIHRELQRLEREAKNTKPRKS